MYIRKDIHKSLRLEAKMAEGAKCFAWAKLFRECDWLLRKKDREIERLRAALEDAAKVAEDKATALSQYRDTHAAVQAATAQDIAEEIKTLIGR